MSTRFPFDTVEAAWKEAISQISDPSVREAMEAGEVAGHEGRCVKIVYNDKRCYDRARTNIETPDVVDRMKEILNQDELYVRFVLVLHVECPKCHYERMIHSNSPTLRS